MPVAYWIRLRLGGDAMTPSAPLCSSTSLTDSTPSRLSKLSNGFGNGMQPWLNLVSMSRPARHQYISFFSTCACPPCLRKFIVLTQRWWSGFWHVVSQPTCSTISLSFGVKRNPFQWFVTWRFNLGRSGASSRGGTTNDPAARDASPLDPQSVWALVCYVYILAHWKTHTCTS